MSQLERKMSKRRMISHQRDAGNHNGLLRFRTFGQRSITDDGEIEVIASTDAPVRMWGVQEVLVHTTEAVDLSPARSVLFNHNPDLVVGAIRSMEIREGKLFARLYIDGDVALENGLNLRKAIAQGMIEGISIRYEFDDEDVDYQRDINTATIKKWRLREITVTPVQADVDSQITARSRAFVDRIRENHQAGDRSPTEITMFKEWLRARGFDPDKLDDAQKESLRALYDAEQARASAPPAEAVGEGTSAPAAPAPAAPAPAAPARTADDDEALRLRAIEQASTITGLCHDFEVEQDEYLRSLSDGKPMATIVQDIRKAAAKRSATPVRTGAAPRTEVIEDEADKYVQHAVRGICARTQTAMPEANGDAPAVPSVRGIDYGQMIRRCALLSGHRDANDWNLDDVARWAMRNMGYQSSNARAANQNAGMFTTIISNVLDLALAQGFNDYEATWQLWCDTEDRNNFQQGTRGALSLADLAEVLENEAIPESNDKDSGYNVQLSMFARTRSLSYQMMVDDRLGEFVRAIRAVGMVGQRTIDRQVYKTLMDGSWTNDTTSSAALSTAANLDKVRSDLRAKPDTKGNRMGHALRYLLHPPKLASAADAACGLLAPAGGRTAELASRAAQRAIPIEADPLADSGLSSNASDTTYYGAAQPGMVDTVLVSYLNGIRAPQVVEFDPGAALSRNVKIFLPFQTTLATHSDGTNTRVTGVQKATA